jgi:hypothetical protein
MLTAGCGSFSTIQATESVREVYSLTCPAGSRPAVLATKPHKGGMLVLVKSASGDCADFIDLYMVGPQGVKGTAAGRAAGQDSFSLNQLQYDNILILFGEFGQKEQINATKALITLKNWQIIEEAIIGENGFILTLKRNSSVVKFDLYDEKDQLLARLEDPDRINRRVYTSELTLFAEMPLPFAPAADQIEEVRVEPFAVEDARPLILSEPDDYVEIVAIVAEHYHEMQRLLYFSEPKFDIIFTVSDGRIMILRKKSPTTYIITYAKGDVSRHFLMEADRLNNPVDQLEKKYLNMPPEDSLQDDENK